MKKLTSLLLITALLSCSVEEKKQTQTREQVIQEIYDMEQAFNDMLASEGQGKAFAHFVAPNGGINRGDKMIIGKDSILAYYSKSTLTDVKLTWKPDFVDVSDDFTMAYTWGPYQFSGLRPNGEAIESTGMFHTVWKKQADGSWRYVYD